MGTVFVAVGLALLVLQIANIAWFAFMIRRNNAVSDFRKKAIDYFYQKRDFSGYYAMPTYDEMLWQLRKWDWSEYLK